jgi:hypothetical protein
VTSKPTLPSTQSSERSVLADGARLGRFHTQQQRALRLNYAAIAIGVLIALYVLVTIIRPLFFSTRPGKATQDFGCISKSVISDCSASSR